MTDRIEIKEGEVGVVRVFDVDLERPEVEAFNRRNGSWPLKEALGAESLDPHYVDLIHLEDLEGLGLSQYLAQGMGVSSHDLEDAHVLIEGLSGAVLVVGSGSFGGRAQMLSPRAPLRLVATFNEDKAPVQFEPLPGGGPQAPDPEPEPEKKTPSDAAISGRVAMIALLVIFALTVVVVWVAS